MRLRVIACAIVSVLFASTAMAYNTEDTFDKVQEPQKRKVGGHEKITDWSVQMRDIPLCINHEAIRVGTRNEDYGNAPARHFYNPSTGKGLPGFENAKTRARSWYELAKKNRSYYDLGHALHLVHAYNLGSGLHSTQL